MTQNAADDKMFYGKFIKSQAEQPTVMQNGTPHNFTVRWFNTREELQRAIDEAWAAGGNGFECQWPEVWGYFRPRPYRHEDGTVSFKALTQEEHEAADAARLGL